MNEMKPDEFEQKLARQPVREIPPAWRAEILAAARVAQPAPHVARVTHHSWLSTINSQLSTLLWPHPKAWAGLAAVWVGIIALNLSTQEKTSSPVAEKTLPPSPEVMAELRQQNLMFAELIGWGETRVAVRPKVFTPSPRSGRAEILMG